MKRGVEARRRPTRAAARIGRVTPEQTADPVPELRVMMVGRSRTRKGQGEQLARRGSLGATFCVAALTAGSALASPCSELPRVDDPARPLTVGVPHIEVEARAGSRIRKGRAALLVDAPYEALRGVLSDPERLGDIVPALRSARIVKTTPDTRHVRQVLGLPFPLRDRTYTVEVREIETSGCFVSTFDYVPGTGNIKSATGRWVLTERGRTTSLLVYEVAADPGGLVPAWAANWAARRALPGTVRAVAGAAQANSARP